MHIGERLSVEGTDPRGVVGLVKRLFVGSGVRLLWNCSDWWITVRRRDTVMDGFVDIPYVHAVESCTADDGT